MEVVTVVTGLPRSGTSMMMQMLDAGGMTCLTDDVRPSDISNPHGYMEYSRVRKIYEDTSWLPLAAGKAIKIVVPLVQYLPKEYLYRVVFMERDIREVIKSQNTMLGQELNQRADIYMIDTFTKEIIDTKALLARRSIPTLYVNYKSAVSSPVHVVNEINIFMGGGLDEAAMLVAVDPTLYRQRG